MMNVKDIIVFHYVLIINLYNNRKMKVDQELMNYKKQ